MVDLQYENVRKTGNETAGKHEIIHSTRVAYTE